MVYVEHSKLIGVDIDNVGQHPDGVDFFVFAALVGLARAFI